jgi:hypothetical protein
MLHTPRLHNLQLPYSKLLFKNIVTGDSVFPVTTVLTQPRLGSDFLVNSKVVNTRFVEPFINGLSCP